jgi:hypothetical protein
MIPLRGDTRNPHRKTTRFFAAKAAWGHMLLSMDLDYMTSTLCENYLTARPIQSKIFVRRKFFGIYKPLVLPLNRLQMGFAACGLGSTGFTAPLAPG